MKWYARYIEDSNVRAAEGLAADELLTTLYDREGAVDLCLRLYTYRPHCALVGRFQNLEAEVDLAYCQAHGVEYSRRLTGGGAIIMGPDQLGICLTARPNLFQWHHIRELYHQLAQPIVDVLQSLGLAVQFRSKNDLEVHSKKIAGLGIYLSPTGAVQFHTSLLYDLDVELMLRILKIPLRKYADRKGIQSVYDRITTLKRETSGSITMEELKVLLRQAYETRFPARWHAHRWTDAEKEQIEQLAEEKYRHPDWLRQYAPGEDMTGMAVMKTPAGLLRAYVAVKGDLIKSVLITGDFLHGERFFSEVEAALKWSSADEGRLRKTLEKVAERCRDRGIEMPVEVSNVVRLIKAAVRKAHVEMHYHYDGSCYYPKMLKKQTV